MTAPARFKQSDIKRAVKGAASAGVRVGRIEIDSNGKIIIIPAAVAANDDGTSDWDDILT